MRSIRDLSIPVIVYLLLRIAGSTTPSSLRKRTTTNIKDSNKYSNTLSTTLQRQTSTRIIGGSIAPSTRYTYFTSLRKVYSDGTTGSHFCGGSLIAPHVVLTAAHCVDTLSTSQLLRVVIGQPDFTIDNEGQVINVRRVIVHPLFTRILDRAPNYDFALLLLETPVDHSVDDDIQFARLNQNENIPEAGDRVTVMGHGFTKITEFSVSSQLKQLDKYVIGNEECRNTTTSASGWKDYENLVTDQMICADDNPEDDVEEDSCNGDSGGPLVTKGDDVNGGLDFILGVISWGYGCAVSGYPGVYARVSEAYDWIQQEICDEENRNDLAPGYFECATTGVLDEKVELEEENVLKSTEIPSFSPSLQPSVSLTSTIPSVMPSGTPSVTPSIEVTSTSPTEQETTLSFIITGIGLDISHPTASPVKAPETISPSISTVAPSVEITLFPTRASDAGEDGTEQPTPLQDVGTALPSTVQEEV